MRVSRVMCCVLLYGLFMVAFRVVFVCACFLYLTCVVCIRCELLRVVVWFMVYVFVSVLLFFAPRCLCVALTCDCVVFVVGCVNVCFSCVCAWFCVCVCCLLCLCFVCDRLCDVVWCVGVCVFCLCV